MSEEQVPTRVESKVTYEDSPNLVTMLSGGALMAFFLYWLSGQILGAFELEYPIIQYFLAAMVITVSFLMGNSSQVTITMDTQSGYIEAEDKQFEYSGYAHEPELFMVLEKKSEANGRTYTDYKLSLKVDDETTFDVPLDRGEVKAAIRNVEKTKNAVPLNRRE